MKAFEFYAYPDTDSVLPDKTRVEIFVQRDDDSHYRAGDLRIDNDHWRLLSMLLRAAQRAVDKTGLEIRLEQPGIKPKTQEEQP